MPTIIRQPKRRALLAYLAIEYPGRFCRRDTLLAMFWPEEDLASGRNCLNQTLHGLRTQLGHDVIISRGKEELGLNPHFSFDTIELLSNLHLPDLPEFEEWSAQQQITHRPKLPSRHFATIAVLVLIALFARSSTETSRTIVLPFTVHGVHQQLGAKVATLLERRVRGEGILRGSVVEANDRLQIDAEWYDVDGKLIRRAHSQAGDASDLAGLVDQVALELF